MLTNRENQLINEMDDKDVKRFTACVINDGKTISGARQSKKLLELNGNTGAKSYKKSNKREQNGAIYWKVSLSCERPRRKNH